jgi:hypothetical protein
MNLVKFNEKMQQFAVLCETLERGSDNMEILSDFVNSEDLDEDTRKIICLKLAERLPLLIVPYQKLSGSIMAVLTPPQPEAPIE